MMTPKAMHRSPKERHTHAAADLAGFMGSAGGEERDPEIKPEAL